METQQTQDPVQDVQDPAEDLKAERVQEEIAALPAAAGKPLQAESEPDPFRMSLKAERVQAPSSLLELPGGTVSLGYEMSFNQMRGVTVELNEPQIVVHLFATGGLVAA